MGFPARNAIIFCSLLAVIIGAIEYYASYVDTSLRLDGVDTQISAIIISIPSLVMGFWFGIIGLFISTLVTWLILLLLKSKLSFKMLLIFSCYLYFVLAPLDILIGILSDPKMTIGLPTMTSIAYWIPSSGILAKLLGEVDLINFWLVYITFFALRELAKLSTQKAVWVTTIITIISVIVDIIPDIT